MNLSNIISQIFSRLRKNTTRSLESRREILRFQSRRGRDAIAIAQNIRDRGFAEKSTQRSRRD